MSNVVQSDNAQVSLITSMLEATLVFLQVSHFSPTAQNLSVVISSKDGVEYEERAVLHYISGNDEYAENNFDHPEKVCLEKFVSLDGPLHAPKYVSHQTLPQDFDVFLQDPVNFPPRTVIAKCFCQHIINT